METKNVPKLTSFGPIRTTSPGQCEQYPIWEIVADTLTMFLMQAIQYVEEGMVEHTFDNSVPVSCHSR